jgi:hypothetical protein
MGGGRKEDEGDGNGEVEGGDSMDRVSCGKSVFRRSVFLICSRKCHSSRGSDELITHLCSLDDRRCGCDLDSKGYSRSRRQSRSFPRGRREPQTHEVSLSLFRSRTKEEKRCFRQWPGAAAVATDKRECLLLPLQSLLTLSRQYLWRTLLCVAERSSFKLINIKTRFLSSLFRCNISKSGRSVVSSMMEVKAKQSPSSRGTTTTRFQLIVTGHGVPAHQTYPRSCT